MINRHFENLKYTRTYIGGSKKKEDERFKDFDRQDEKDELNWFDYRKAWMTHYDDLLNVIFSYKLLFQKVSYVLAALGLVELFLNMFIGLIIIGSSIIVHLAFYYLRYKQRREVGNYGAVLSILNLEIQRRYKVKLNLNPQKQ